MSTDNYILGIIYIYMGTLVWAQLHPYPLSTVTSAFQQLYILSNNYMGTLHIWALTNIYGHCAYVYGH